MGSIAGEVRRLNFCARLAATVQGEVGELVDVARIARDQRVAVMVTDGAGVTRVYGTEWEYAERLGAEQLARKIIQLIRGNVACRD